MLVDHLGPWSGSLVWRRLGKEHVNDGDAYPTDSGYSEWNLNVGYALKQRWRLNVGIFNLFNTHDYASVYYYAARLAGEPADGVEGLQVHPLEPRAARFSITKIF